MGKDREVGETKTLACAAVVGTVKDSMVETQERRVRRKKMAGWRGVMKRWVGR
jgi:hypothetical protein